MAGSMISSTECTIASSADHPGSMTGFRVRCSVAGPSAAQTGPTEARSGGRGGVPALGAIQHRVVGEQLDVGVRVPPAGCVVGAGDDVEDVEPIRGRQGHGRSHAPIRARRSSGKTLLGMTACTALAGIEL